MSPEIKTRNYRLYDALQGIGAVGCVILAIIILPIESMFIRALLGCIPAAFLVIGYQVWRPSDLEIELESSLAESVNYAADFAKKTGQLREIGQLIADIAMVIFAEGVLRHEQRINHLPRICSSVNTYIENDDLSDLNSVLIVLRSMRDAVNQNRQKRFERARDEILFLQKLYSSNSAAGQAVEMLQQILSIQTEKES